MSSAAPPSGEELLWNRLSPSCRRAFELARGVGAAAGEAGPSGHEVGSGDLLAGIYGAHRGMSRPSEVQDLLEWAGVPFEDVWEAVSEMRQVPRPSSRLEAWKPVPLDGFPTLSRNVRRALDNAEKLARNAGGDDIHLAVLWGGVLQLRPDALAIRALDRFLGETLNDVRSSYFEYLRLGESVRYLDFLRSRFPRDEDSVPKPPRESHLARASNDAIGDTDQLGFADYVAAFADLVESPETTPPLTIGIFGSWGMGKSFLLHHLERELGDRRRRRAEAAAQGFPTQPAAPVYVVRFNAWSYSAAKVIWPALVRTILQTVDDATLTRWGRLRTRLARNLGRQVRQDRVTIFVSLVVAVAVLAAAAARDNWDIAFFLGISVLGLAKVVTDTVSSPLGRWVGGLLADDDYGATIDVMEEIRCDLDRLGERLADRNGRILVLIDDLDRCEAEKAVEVLQAINLLLNFATFVVVLGIDARVVTRAIEKCQGGVMEAAGATGFEYLEKIVQIPFRIPEPDEDGVAAFLRDQLGPAERPPEPEPEVSGAGPLAGATTVDSVPEVKPAEPPAQVLPTSAVEFTGTEIEAFEELAPYLRANPRHLKRLVNVYRLVRTLAELRVEAAILDDPRRTIQWITLCSQWPYAARAMLARLDDLGDARPAGGSNPLRRLLDDVEPQLDADVRKRLDHDPDGLVALVDDGSAFTWEELKTVKQYTVNFNPAVDAELADLVFEDSPRPG